MSVRSFALGCRWHVRALRRNPLIRPSDRLEALSVLVLLLLSLLMIPVATRTADRAYDATLRVVHEETQTRHPVQTTVVEGSTRLPTDFDAIPNVTVRWRDGTRERTESIVSAGTVAAGTELTVWLDASGKVVSKPMTEADASVNATSAGWTVWLVAVVFNGLVGLAVRKGLDRSRARSWERELRLLAHNDDGWANRRT